MIAAVMATSYLPVETPARMPVQGRISCLTSNGANLRKSSISSLSKPVGLPSFTNSKGRKSSSVATISPRFLISSRLPALAMPANMGIAISATARPSVRRLEIGLERASEPVVMMGLPFVGVSVEAKTVGAQRRRKRRALGFSRLARLVFRPAVEGGFAVFCVGALLLLRDRMQRIPPVVVIVDAPMKRTVVIAIAVRRHAAWQPKAHIAFALRIAEAKGGNGEDEIGQFENVSDLIDLVADDADRTDPEPNRFRAQDHGLHGKGRVDAGVEEAFERSIRDRLAAHLADALQPSGVAEKDKEHR